MTWESKDERIKELENKLNTAKNALNNVLNTVKDSQDEIYDSVFYLDSKDGRYIFDTVSNALKEIEQ